MGRWSYSQKYEVEDCSILDIKFLKDNGYFSSYGKGGAIKWTYMDRVVCSIDVFVSGLPKKTVTLSYTVGKPEDDNKQSVQAPIETVATKCNFGGVRYWFRCPLRINGIPCNRIVSKLYLAPNCNYFGCRHCLDLTYNKRKRNYNKGTFGLFARAFNLDVKRRDAFLKVKRVYYNKEFTKNFRKFLMLSKELKQCSIPTKL